MPEPEKYPLNPGQLPGGALLHAFGALGGAVLAGIESSRYETATNEFTTAIKPTRPAIAQHWNESLLLSLQSKGYQAMLVPELPMKKDAQETDCASIAGKYDAVMVSSISSGYAVSDAVQPVSYAKVKMLSSDCGETYFSDAFSYSTKPMPRTTHSQSDARFNFPSRELLLSNPELAKEAMRTGVGTVARQAAAL
ncbi:hypothetical protein [Azohydromonas lata]|uniref:Uncharacterized protein n=1 Tax=Azohydromonas lata TaxID=45677 RepID=A0ABU5IGU1_9BURK|nr:hypothetical protein [Azohydromonas lata]MDZ5458351.1 hypothetical protein [Azohydromonas lata]